MKKGKKEKEISICKASDFWDEHDFGEFDDIKEEKGIQYDNFLNKTIDFLKQ
ncbi:MAG: hypothetical protein HZA00_04235 [Nitrospinae bacterium]|nr:hypothetical protein [Nitrospinota bacterium]